MPGSQKKQVGFALDHTATRREMSNRQDVTEAWWGDMPVQWFDVPEEERHPDEEGGEAKDSDASPTVQSKA